MPPNASATCASLRPVTCGRSPSLCGRCSPTGSNRGQPFLATKYSSPLMLLIFKYSKPSVLYHPYSSIFIHTFLYKYFKSQIQVFQNFPPPVLKQTVTSNIKNLYAFAYQHFENVFNPNKTLFIIISYSSSPFNYPAILNLPVFDSSAWSNRNVVPVNTLP